MSKKILVVDDEKPIADILQFNLKKEGYQVVCAYNGDEALKKVEEDQPDLMLLDIMLPNKDGMEVCREIRKKYDFPIIMLTAKDSEIDKVLGLELGADDYVTKPFSPITLLARMKALHRRAHVTSTQEEVEIPSDFDVETEIIHINTSTREAYYNDKPIENLTPKEFDLLVAFTEHPKRVFSREDLLTSLWEDPFYGDERTVDAHIKKLRQKIEQVGPQIIQTVWGVGYKYESPGEE